MIVSTTLTLDCVFFLPVLLSCCCITGMNNFNLFLYACHTVWYGIGYGIKTFLRLLNVTNTTVCAWVLTELLPHPVYAWKQMSPLSILGGKNFHSSIA